MEENLSWNQRPRVLIDLSTSFLWRGKNAVGIVRTERELATRLLKDDSLDVLPVVFRDGNICAIDPEQALRLVSITAPVTANVSIVAKGDLSLETKEPSLKSRLFQLAKRLVRRIGRGILRFAPDRAKDDVRASMIHAYHAIHSIAQKTTPAPVVQVPAAENEIQIDFDFVVHPNKNDVLFLGGLGWDVVDCRRIGILQAQSGMKVASVMFDLIPTKMPEFLGGKPKDYFRNYFIHMVDLCDHIFCISKTTRSDLMEFCVAEGRTCPSTSVIYLGANLPAAPSDEEFSDTNTSARLKTGRFALSVGTFEVRKNYGFLLSRWEELVKDPTFDLDLVIAGMPGWGTEELVARLESSPLFGKRIFWFKGLSDKGISWLYENCHVFLFPSLYEGWGLPIIEALQHGKPVVASTRGSVPEAGLGVAKIIDLDRPEEWMAEIRRHSARSLPEEIPPITIPSWDKTVSSVKSALMAIA